MPFECETCETLYQAQLAAHQSYVHKARCNEVQKRLGASEFELPYSGLVYPYPSAQIALSEHLDTCKIFNPPKTSHKGNGTYSGPWAFTITCSPKDNFRFGDMIKAVEKVMKQKSRPAIKYVWYLENKGVDDMGEMIHPHIHGMYETATGGRIEAKHWIRAWPIWNENEPLGKFGFRGGYHRPVTHEEGYSNYIKEDGGANGSLGLCLLTDQV